LRHAGSIAFVLLSGVLHAATPADPEQGLPLIHVYSPAVFDSPATPVGSQVFDLARPADGTLLVANNEGLLRLDGTGWRTWNPIRGAILALDARADGRVFVGGVDDLGYFDRFGRDFVSLRDWATTLGKPFGEFWVVLAGKRLTHFVDRERAYRWDGERLQLVYEAHGETRQGTLLAGAAVILDPAAGLIQLEASPVRPIAGSEILVGAHDCALGAAGTQIATLCDDGLLRLWSSSGLLRTIELQKELQRQFADAKPSTLAALDSGGYAVATRQGGLFLLDEAGELRAHLSQFSGLDNVRIFSVLATGVDGLWLGRDHGLAMIEWPGQVSRYDIDIGLPRIPLGVGRIAGQLYVATSAGVYRLQPGPNGFARAAPYALIGNVLFDIAPSADTLFIPARDGLYALGSSGVQRLDPRLCYVAQFIDGSPQHVLVGGDNGAWVIEHAVDGWRTVGDVPGIHSEIRRIVAEGPNTIWLASRAARQLFRVSWKGGSWSPDAAVVENYSTADGLPAGPITPLVMPDGVAFASSTGLFRFDAASRRFHPDGELNVLLPLENGEVRASMPIDDQRVVVVQHDRYRLLRRSPRGWIEETSPLARIPRGAAPRSLYRDADGSFWVTTSDAVYRHLPASQSALPSLPPPRVELDRGHGAEPVPATATAPLHAGVAPMRLAFRFSSAVYVGADRVAFRSRLLPIESGWSAWSNRSTLELGYVPGGDFVLEVQARDIFDRISRTTRVKLHLDRPWYLSRLAFVLYALVLLVGVLLIVRRRDRALRRRASDLETQVRERTQALEKASVTDQLTGLHNRHYFDIATRELLADGERTLVALIDLDYFKRINDTRGHDVGDQVLMDVAGRLLAVAPTDAVLFRWGGEEFLLLAPLADDGDKPAAVVARILNRIGDAPILLASDSPAALSPVAMTCSIGWEIAPMGDGPSIREALRRADLDLYAAKQAGRDRAHGPNGIVSLRQRP
jgi:diguanylate cyclase (GGDEF)-like protein